MPNYALYPQDQRKRMGLPEGLGANLFRFTGGANPPTTFRQTH
jgi:hypothetical protein